ncbi:hypothetical protein [Aeromonas veronii]|uniref:hypothetical protein n=1 Tax=Aeromonas veronii TaxID=654 RepID=UPI002443A0D9|nr:hypothetical protein [Aeromonas veronii]
MVIKEINAKDRQQLLDIFRIGAKQMRIIKLTDCSSTRPPQKAQHPQTSQAIYLTSP